MKPISFFWGAIIFLPSFVPNIRLEQLILFSSYFSAHILSAWLYFHSHPL